MTRHPIGKGYFVWQLSRCAGGDPFALAAMARAAGLSWVALKTHNGTADRNGNLRAHATALRAAGVEPWGWGYIYGVSPAAEAAKAVQRNQAAGLQGYFINAEKEYKAPGMAAPAGTFVRTVRTMAPELPLGLCSYRFPTLHPEFPWAAFLGACDFHAPQVYWLEDSGPTAPALQLRRSVAELRARRDLPFVPLGSASPNDAGTWLPTVAQLNNFDAAAHEIGLPGVGWWAWDHAEKHPGWWATITAHQWGGPVPPASMTAAERAIIRKAMSDLSDVAARLQEVS